MAKYVRVVRTEMEFENICELFAYSCFDTGCNKCPMCRARKENARRHRKGKKYTTCLERFVARPNYWTKRFGWEVEDNE